MRERKMKHVIFSYNIEVSSDLSSYVLSDHCRKYGGKRIACCATGQVTIFLISNC